MNERELRAAAERMSFESIERRLDIQEERESRFMLEEFRHVRDRDFDAARRAHRMRGHCLDRHMVLLQIREAKRELTT